MQPKSTFSKSVGAALLSIMLISSALMAPPLQSRAEPTILSILIGGVLGSLGIDFFSCGFNILFYCDEGGNVVGSSNGGSSGVQNPCTSPANACGQTNTGFLSSDGSVCSASAPSNSSCPNPSIGTNDFYAQPNIIGPNMSSTLHWTATNATECSITSNNGFSQTGLPTSGSQSTGPISATATFNLSCQNGDGGPQSSASVKVIVDPHFMEI